MSSRRSFTCFKPDCTGPSGKQDDQRIPNISSFDNQHLFVRYFNALNLTTLVHHGNKIIKEVKTFPFLIVNICLSDILMPLYLFMFLSVDIFYNQTIVIFLDTYRKSLVCYLMLVLSSISSQMSLFSVTILTCFLSMTLTAGKNTFWSSKRLVCLIAILPWFLSIALSASMALFIMNSDCGMDQTISCVLTNLASANIQESYCPWWYIGFVFLLVNIASLCFFVVFSLRIIFIRMQLYHEVRMMGRVSGGKSSASTQLSLAAICLANLLPFLCQQLLLVLVLSGQHVSGEASVWLSILVLPLNSIINPLLYTLRNIVHL